MAKIGKRLSLAGLGLSLLFTPGVAAAASAVRALGAAAFGLRVCECLHKFRASLCKMGVMKRVFALSQLTKQLENALFPRETLECFDGGYESAQGIALVNKICVCVSARLKKTCLI